MLIELIRTVTAEVSLYIGYKSVILILSLPNGTEHAYTFDLIEESNKNLETMPGKVAT